MPGRSSTVASTSSVSRSRPPRIGFSISGLVCVSPSYSTSSTCARAPLRQRRQGGVRVRVKPPRARPATPCGRGGRCSASIRTQLGITAACARFISPPWTGTRLAGLPARRRCCDSPNSAPDAQAKRPGRQRKPTSRLAAATRRPAMAKAAARGAPARRRRAAPPQTAARCRRARSGRRCRAAAPRAAAARPTSRPARARAPRSSPAPSLRAAYVAAVTACWVT